MVSFIRPISAENILVRESVRLLNPRSRCGVFCRIGTQAPNLIDLALQGHALQLVEGQRQEQFDAPVKPVVEIAESGNLSSVRPLDRRRIGNAPMRRYRLSRPDRAGLGRRLIAHREDEIHLGRVGFGEFAPAFGMQTLNRQILHVQHSDG